MFVKFSIRRDTAVLTFSQIVKDQPFIQFWLLLSVLMEENEQFIKYRTDFHDRLG